MKHPNILEHIGCGYTAIINAFAKGLEPPERLSVMAWADSRRRLPSRGSSEPGKWRTSRTPFLAEIMECLDPYHPCQRVVFMKSSQVGGTEVLLNWVGWFVDTQRSSMMVVQPTLDMAEKWSKQRFAPMIGECPTLQEKIAPARSRDSGNTTLMKEWPGGLIAISGSNSAASLAMMPIANLGLDEVDRYPLELDGEGDPIKIAEARTTTYPNRKIFLISSPTIESLSRINKEFLKSDQRKYLIPCPHCGHEHELLWENLHYEDSAPEKAQMVCPDCGGLFDDTHKQSLLEKGRWVATNPDSKVPGFHISGLYAPTGLGKTWGELAEEFEEVKYDASRLKVFKNTRLGLCEKDPSEKLEWQELKHRAEDYPLRTLPEGCYEVSVGIDVQHKYFAVLVLGWGVSGKRWVLDYVEIPGNPFVLDGYKALTDFIRQPLQGHDGSLIQPRSLAIDSSDGKTYETVLEYVRSRPVVGLFAIKGAATRGRPVISRPSKVEYSFNGRQIPGGMEQWQVGVDTAKHALFGRLKMDGALNYAQDRQIHFSNQLPDFFYVQFTAEIYDPNRARWVKHRSRNEALDCYVYAEAAGQHPQARFHARTQSQWDAMAQAQSQAGLFSLPEATGERSNTSDTAPRTSRVRGRMR